MAVFVGLEPFGTRVCLIAQSGVDQHRPIQTRAGCQGLDFVCKQFLEGGAENRGRRADNREP